MRGVPSGHMSEDAQLESDARAVASAKKSHRLKTGREFYDARPEARAERPITMGTVQAQSDRLNAESSTTSELDEMNALNIQKLNRGSQGRH